MFVRLDQTLTLKLVETGFFTLAWSNAPLGSVVKISPVIIETAACSLVCVFSFSLLPDKTTLVGLRRCSGSVSETPLCCALQFVQWQWNVVVLSLSHEPCPQVWTQRDQTHYPTDFLPAGKIKPESLLRSSVLRP